MNLFVKQVCKNKQINKAVISDQQYLSQIKNHNWFSLREEAFYPKLGLSQEETFLSYAVLDTSEKVCQPRKPRLD